MCRSGGYVFDFYARIPDEFEEWTIFDISSFAAGDPEGKFKNFKSIVSPCQGCTMIQISICKCLFHVVMGQLVILSVAPFTHMV